MRNLFSAISFRLGYYVLCLMCVSFLLIKIFASSIGATVISTSFSNSYHVGLLFPEGWGFFTRSPREFQYELYHLNRDSSLELTSIKNNAFSNALGFSRKSRRLNLEFQRLLSKLPDSVFVSGEHWSVRSYQIKLSEIPSVLYISPGQYVVKRYLITPWSWVNYPEHFEPEVSQVKIEVKV